MALDEAAIKEALRLYVMTPEEKYQQALSFAYGNVHLSNPDITRDDIEKAMKELEGDKINGNDKSDRR